MTHPENTTMNDGATSAHLDDVTTTDIVSGSKNSNTTHRRRLARRLAERTGRPYAAALEIVTRAADAGRLPEPLDAGGMDRALKMLMATEPGEPDTPTDSTASHTAADGPEVGTCLVPSSLAALRLVWQGRVTKEPHRGASRFTVDDKPATTGVDLDLALLERDGYITASLVVDEEWAVARTTDLGDEVLAANGADRDRFRDGLPEGVQDGFRASGARAVQASLDRRSEDRAGQEEPRTGAAVATQTSARTSARTTWRVAHEGNDVPRCEVSSWRDKASRRDPNGYGPGGYNRCVKAAGHDGPTDHDNHGPHHLDEWGHLFRLDQNSFRVLGEVSHDEMAQVAREAGMHVSDGSDMRPEPVLPRPMTLWVISGRGATAEIVKVSTVYAEEERLTAQVVLPVPPRTTVRSFTLTEARQWREPTDAEVRRYDRAWGFEG